MNCKQCIRLPHFQLHLQPETGGAGGLKSLENGKEQRRGKKVEKRGAETRLDARVGAGLERVDEREKGGGGKLLHLLLLHIS